MPIIPARSGIAQFLRASQKIRVVNTHGHQVVDTWAFVLPSVSTSKPHPTDQSGFPIEYMSMSHSRAALNALRPTIGSTLVSNRRQPVLELSKDTSPGVHDMLIAACDVYRYQTLLPALRSGNGYHENCSDNLHIALQQALASVTNDLDGINLAKLVAGLKGYTPDPLNLFMNIPWTAGDSGGLSFNPPLSKPGDYVELKALRDVLVAFSACPQDLLDINGGSPVDVEYEVVD